MFAVNIDYGAHRVTVRSDRRASFDLKGAVAAAKLWAAHTGFELALIEGQDATT